MRSLWTTRLLRPRRHLGLQPVLADSRPVEKERELLRLTDVYDVGPSLAGRILYELLQERPPEANISHRQMPSYEAHKAFVASRPYKAWYLIEDRPETYEAAFFELQRLERVGSVALTRANEVAVAIFATHQRKGYAFRAVTLLRERHPGPLLANVAPGNTRSHALFLKLGARVIQHTYQLPPGERP